MLSGLQEILVIIILIGILFFLPRIISKKTSDRTGSLYDFGRKLTKKRRAEIVISFFYPCAAAVYFEPWNKNLPFFIYFGTFPVIAYWSIIWIFRGFKKNNSEQ